MAAKSDDERHEELVAAILAARFLQPIPQSGNIERDRGVRTYVVHNAVALWREVLAAIRQP